MAYTELLSPAGGPEALRAAVQAGADAVYLGEKNFSARSGAENFTPDELKEAVRYAKIRGCGVYLALNTLIFDKEIDLFSESVKLAADAGVDALIIQDFGGGKIAKEICPKMPLHASTQMSAHNEKDVEALLEAGFSRVVLARELKREEIIKIKRNTGAEIEVFVHGALCVCASGQCLMSSFIGGRSGNRGRCAQPCRQRYLSEGKQGYFLSPKDLCLLDEIGDMTEIGINSLKIEGRMKRAEYVAAVTKIYRKYLDERKKAAKGDIDELKKIFVRGSEFTKGYYSGYNTPEIMNPGVSNDNISEKTDKDALKRAREIYRDGAENKKTEIDARFKLKSGEKSALTLCDGKNEVTAEGRIPENALKSPLDRTLLRDWVGKLGQTPYELKGFEADIDDGLTLSAKDINAMRREAAKRLSDARGAAEKRETYEFKYSFPHNMRGKSLIAAQIMNEKQLEGVRGADIVYMPVEVYEKSDKRDNYSPSLPKVTYNIEKYILRLKRAGAKRALCPTIGAARALAEAGIEPIGDYSLNITNSVSANEYEKAGISHLTLSPELSCAQLRAVASSCGAKCEILVYGRMMLMTTRACIIKEVRGKCDCDTALVLKDRTGAEFLVYSDKFEHINTIYNGAVTFMADKLDSVRGIADIMRLVFTSENPREVERIIAMHKGEAEVKMPKSFTRGYFFGNKKS